LKISIIGASAGVGLEATRLALQQGHEVTTLSRRIDSLPDHPKLRRVQGSSTSLQDVRAALEGSDAILVTLGTGSSTKATTLYSESARILVQVLQESKSSAPLIVLTGFGAGESWSYNSLVMKLLFNLLLKAVYADKSEMEHLIASGYPCWEIVRPGRLTDGKMTGRYRVLDNLVKAERPTYLGKYPALSS